MDQSIFKAYDIRGLYPSQIDEQAVYAITRATVRHLKAKKMTIATDNRGSSPALKNSVIDALMDEGVYVVDAGVATTPMFYFAVNKAQTDGGIMITASHNPPEYNGLKITAREARPVGENSGLQEIKRMALAGNFPSTVHDGAIKKTDFLDAYADFLLEGVSLPSITLAVDGACGAVGVIINKIKERTGVKILPLCFAPCERLAHEGNPMKDENVEDLMSALRAGKADLGVAFDGDADRVFFFDKTGERIPTHAVACILAERYLASHPKASIIADVRMPKIFQETAERNNGAYFESRVGHAFIKQLMRERGAVFAAEVSGHFYFKDFFNADSGMFALVQILNILARGQKTLAELARPFLTRFQSGEQNYTVKDKQAALDALEKAFQDGHVTHLDGLSAHFPDWWFNARPSNTEPFLRVNIEADTQGLLEESRKNIENIIFSDSKQ
ncbi:hypothetical protein A3C91_04955 [Candidatus Azambacteria bacterium RIFCSPHIGHO2_02_FULL_52_12]|uniref:Phosphomannomutase/phosphoglucomutase n=1 Tax=Candidatus Azambacteria bacterium RIFCSPLOWO2_01_FULL_46_25 TaxID=1797298 RepID=A0A1F5BVY4_9BACT|nr:MAG: hypothetical protein A3C91_04955 [Candidatus Azambacteria bacterium RIFCSPHIGHO2_02_FULL_52_12]OGD34738.1 MAG: hypothetical protein A2988_04565 [Candidatus Azambacteria bacterium RIFCSPLOWO2_01_FULL_46_25]OGD37185.1 MAG: hypothetical protein A2850_04840 [Candidatus Azambacteria bacterium RIFCSPHIGHO2_01_FULL_51_74]